MRLMAGLMCIAALMTSTSGCSAGLSKRKTGSGDIPEIPERLEVDGDHVPMLKVYDTATEDTQKMDVESYIMGVVAGEMKNDWPMEALKAQAILARTFTMRFVSGKKSAYDGADISTDVQEAQAYDAAAINDRVREAVNDTRGQVMTADGEFPYAWFHAHSGGMTELPSKALEYGEDPVYLSAVRSEESEDAPQDVQNWTVKFTLEEVEKACADAGVEVGTIRSFELGEKGESGRTVNFKVNGKTVSAPSFRIQIGASRLKSTLIRSAEIEGDAVVFTGSGFGHGVGMSQWGAYQMAKDGKTAEKIIEHYYTDVDIVELW